jgi:hypothetical protein
LYGFPVNSGRNLSEGAKHRPLIIITLALVAMFAVACGSSGNAGAHSGATAGGTINIGLIADLTGTATYPEGVDGATAAIDAVNKVGGINGDSQDNPNVGKGYRCRTP